jgi:biotin transport system substrate-specific component
MNTFSKLIFSVSFIYILGLIWLGTLIGWNKPIFKLGAQPFLLAELFKLLLLVFLTPTLLKVKKLIKIT